MKKKSREYISAYIKRELAHIEGTYTFIMCKCKRHGCRGERCWECWLDLMVEGKGEKE